MFGYGFRQVNRSILGAGGGVSTLWDDLLAYYTADNTPNDALSTYNGTLTNGATYGSGIISNGFSFDGVNDYVNLGDNLDIRLDSWTYNFWINMDTVNRRNSILTKTDSGNNWERWWYRVNLSNKLEFHLQKGTNSVTDRKYFISTQTLSASTWYMVTVVLDRTDKAYMYINGSPETIISTDGNGTTITNELSSWGAFDFNTGFNSCIGATSTSGNSMDGIIDEGGIWNRALTSTEVTELYNSGAGKQYPTGIDVVWSDLLAYYTADNTPNDALSTYNGTLTNGATYGSGIINQGFSLDGVNDYVDLGNNLDFDGSTPFSFNAWINPDTSHASSIISKGLGAPTYTGYRFLFVNDRIQLSLNSDYSSGDSLYVSTAAFTIPTNSLSMVTVTYDGSKNASGVTFYINGSTSANNIITNNLTGSISNTTSAKIGGYVGLTNWFNGIIDEVSSFNKELTQSEVTELYNSGAGKQY